MEIKTKFNVGDMAYCLNAFGDIVRKRVQCILIFVGEGEEVCFQYFFLFGDMPIPFDDDKVFAEFADAAKYKDQKNAELLEKDLYG